MLLDERLIVCAHIRFEGEARLACFGRRRGRWRGHADRDRRDACGQGAHRGAIYLLHLPFLALAFAALTCVGWNIYIESLVAIVASGALSLATHRLLVHRFAVAAFLLNGRPLPRRAAAAQIAPLPALA